ncbi:MAG: arylesterase [Pseudomonadota bacterium]
MLMKSTTLLATFLLLLALQLGSKAETTHSMVVYGDSLSAAYGIDEEQGWVALLANAVSDSYSVYNASISGETSAGGLARLNLTLEELEPDLLILELGANDGLRGASTSSLKQNLQAMIHEVKERDIQLVLVGISAPPNYGPRYIDQFRSVYTDLAKDNDLPFIDFYREEFFLKEGFIQNDGLHPTAIAQPIIKDLMLEFLQSQKFVQAPVD